MTIRDEIRHLHSLLRHRSKWYIDFSCPDDPAISEIAERAKENADALLSEMSVDALYGRYNKWIKAMPPVEVIKGKVNERYYDNFLDDVVWSLGASSLRGKDKRLFEECVNLYIKFL